LLTISILTALAAWGFDLPPFLAQETGASRSVQSRCSVGIEQLEPNLFRGESGESVLANLLSYPVWIGALDVLTEGSWQLHQGTCPEHAGRLVRAMLD
jgi:hypothetical protein